jgi:hypothetical protein
LFVVDSVTEEDGTLLSLAVGTNVDVAEIRMNEESEERR